MIAATMAGSRKARGRVRLTSPASRLFCRARSRTEAAFLNVGGGYGTVQEQALRIDENVALLARDQLARVKTGRIDARPPFSALFTLWLSMMQAVGLASRPAFSRHLA